MFAAERWPGRWLRSSTREPNAPSRALYPTAPESLPDGPSIVVVSPYKVLPTGDDAAAATLRALSRQFRVVLLSDVAHQYDARDVEGFAGLAAVHLVDGRHEPESELGQRVPRIRNHSHGQLRRALRALLAERPAAVLVQHIELGLLIEERARRRAPLFVIQLFLPILTDGDPGQTDDDRYEQRLVSRFDAAVAGGCEPRDIARLVGNWPGAGLRRGPALLLTTTLAAADALGARLPRRSVGAPLQWRPGCSVVIPERGRPDLLAEALRSVYEAALEAPESVEVVVVVNGWPAAAYGELRARFPEVRWLFSAAPLGFSGAVDRGVRAARHDWVYLLNSDMVLARDALREILRWRGSSRFALSSQIFFADRRRRREETGWTDAHLGSGVPAPYDAEPEHSDLVRGNLYAGGGASLFHRSTLLALLPPDRAYAPAYIEDVEWGIRAWREGYEVLFVPRSHAYHHHRATVERFYTGEQIERIWRRNLVQLTLRNPGLSAAPWLLDLDFGSQRALTRPGNLGGLFRARLAAARAPMPQVALGRSRQRFYPTPPDEQKDAPCIVVATPFVFSPPSHGGAVRIRRLLEALAGEFRVVVVSDEAGRYRAASWSGFAGLEAVHLVDGRRELPPLAGEGERARRIRAHSHPALRREIARAVACHRPQLVQIEYLELAATIPDAPRAQPWVLDLHDVLVRESGPETDDDRFERELVARYDAALVCCEEDGALLRHPRLEVIRNGADTSRQCEYVPSLGRRTLLFSGPFRYPPNLAGIEIFLRRVYPRLRERIAELELVVLGGDGAADVADAHDYLRQPGVRVLDTVSDVRPYLEAAAVSINPQYGTRGSSLKLIESLAAGRVCVTTRDGARGYLARPHPALVVVDRIEDFGGALEPLLLRDDERVLRERPQPEQLAEYDWRHIGAELAGVHRRLMAEWGEGQGSRRGGEA